MGFTFSAEDVENLESGELPTPGEGVAATPATPTPTPAPQEFRYGEDAPPELRGKTPQDAAALFAAARDTAKLAFERLQQTSVQPAAAAPVRKEDIELTSEDLVGDDPGKVNTKLNRLFEAKAAPVINELLQNQSNQIHTLMRAHPSMPYFQRYEQEILASANRLPVSATAKAETWQLLYQTTVAQHLPEILNEQKAEWERARSTPPPSERGRGGPPNQQRRGLSDEQKTIARSLGVSEEEYLKFLPQEG
jgi:hypothetical protein